MIDRTTLAPARITVSGKTTLWSTTAPASTTTPGPMTLRLTSPATTHPELSQALEMRPSLQEMYVGGKRWIWHRIPFREGITDGLTFQAKDKGTTAMVLAYIGPGRNATVGKRLALKLKVN